jgi:hypothetical protein
MFLSLLTEVWGSKPEFDFPGLQNQISPNTGAGAGGEERRGGGCDRL